MIDAEVEVDKEVDADRSVTDDDPEMLSGEEDVDRAAGADATIEDLQHASAFSCYSAMRTRDHARFSRCWSS